MAVANPLNLQIGEAVKVKCSSLFGYDDQNYRFLYKDYTKKGSYFIVGVTRRAEGQYHKAEYTSEGYEPATFTAKKFHTLYEVKECITSKSVLVHPDDIEEGM